MAAMICAGFDENRGGQVYSLPIGGTMVQARGLSLLAPAAPACDPNLPFSGPPLAFSAALLASQMLCSPRHLPLAVRGPKCSRAH